MKYTQKNTKREISSLRSFG